MIRLSSILETFEADFLARYGEALLPSQRKALEALKHCRTSASLSMQAQCTECDHPLRVPHSCGHRACPHCQHHESQRWIERQLQRQVPTTYFLITFTLPAAFRPLAWTHQRTLYGTMTRCAWETVRTFARNDRQLQGEAGAIAVLHTHSRRLDGLTGTPTFEDLPGHPPLCHTFNGTPAPQPARLSWPPPNTRSEAVPRQFVRYIVLTVRLPSFLKACY